MSDPRQQHYVPRVYLQHFCYDKEQEHLYAYDKYTKKVFAPHIENIAQERDYNTVSSLEDKYYFERYFSSNVEPELGHILDRIISKSVLSCGNVDVINMRDREKLSRMIVYQMLRTRSAREFMRDKADSVTVPFIEKLLDLPQIKRNPDLSSAIKEYRILDNNRFKEIMLPEAINAERIERYSTILDSMLCTFYGNATKELFITSDNPVTIKRLLSHEIGLGSAGLGIIDCVIIYPLNPRLVAILFHREFAFARGFKKYENRIYPISQLEIIRTLNGWQYMQSHRQIYSQMPIKL